MTGILNSYSYGDPDFGGVYLLLHMNGANGGVSFPDSSSYARAVGVAGNAQTSTAVSKFNGSSGLFDGVGDYLGTDDAPFDFLTLMTLDFTVESWVYRTTTGVVRCIAQMGSAAVDNPEFTFNLGTGNEVYWALGSATAKTQTTVAAIQVAINTWTHVAATFTAATGVMDCWTGGSKGIGGTAIKPAGTPAFPIATDLNFGAYTDGISFPWVGNLAELRITRGVNRYPAPFTPPTNPFPNF